MRLFVCIVRSQGLCAWQSACLSVSVSVSLSPSLSHFPSFCLPHVSVSECSRKFICFVLCCSFPLCVCAFGGGGAQVCERPCEHACVYVLMCVCVRVCNLSFRVYECSLTFMRVCVDCISLVHFRFPQLYLYRCLDLPRFSPDLNFCVNVCHKGHHWDTYVSRLLPLCVSQFAGDMKSTRRTFFHSSAYTSFVTRLLHHAGTEQ